LSKEVNFSINNGNNTGGSNNNNNSITGDWNFINSIAHTKSTVTVAQGSDELKSVTVSDYVTKNNTGTIKITPIKLYTQIYHIQ